MVTGHPQGAHVGLESLYRGTAFHEYRNAHHGDTVWVIGSGATLAHIAPSFFDGKTCVAVNYAGHTAGLRQFYTVTNHHDDAQAVATAHPQLPVITSTVEQVPDKDTSRTPLTAPNIITVPTVAQSYVNYTTALHWPDEPDLFTIGPTSVHLALHWAAYLGAGHIVLVGVDCGDIDGTARIAGYPNNPDGTVGHLHFGLWERTLRDIAGRLRRDGIGVHSLNPFVTLAREGHTFRQ